jgi:ABC-type sugar transport system ATPase subunit
VAGFIGSPTMNLLRGRVEENRRCLRIGDSVRLEVGAEIPAEPGDEILAGVRPEHVVLHNGAALPENHCELDTVVELLEPLGSDTVIHCMLNGKGEHMLTARLPGATRLSEGDRIRLHFPCAGLHLFDPSTGRRIASQ